MKKSIILLISLLLIHCGSKEEKTTEDLIANEDFVALQNKKAAVVKTLNAYKTELDLINTALGKLDPEQRFALVTAITLETQAYNHYVSFQGTLSTDRNLVLYPEIPGLLKNINVSEGQRVKKGQRLATLTDGGLVDQLQQLQLQLELAKTTFERQERLWDQKIGSELQYLQAKTQYLSLQKSVTQMRDQVQKTSIEAPFDGIVDHLIADQGSNMVPGVTPIVRLINLDQMKVEAELPEKHLPNIQSNSSVEVNIPVLGEKRTAKVTSVGNFINPNNRSFRVEIALDNKDGSLKPNMTVELKINDYQNLKAIVVPTKNILEDQNGKTYVYTLKASKGDADTFIAVKTYVETGKSSNNSTEILSGLQADDRLIEDGIRLVEDQQLVKIIQS